MDLLSLTKNAYKDITNGKTPVPVVSPIRLKEILATIQRKKSEPTQFALSREEAQAMIPRLEQKFNRKIENRAVFNKKMLKKGQKRQIEDVIVPVMPLIDPSLSRIEKLEAMVKFLVQSAGAGYSTYVSGNGTVKGIGNSLNFKNGTNTTAVVTTNNGGVDVAFNATGGSTVTLYTDTVSGTINGSNKVFTVANSITQALTLFLAGMPYQPTVDFTVSGMTITFVTAPDASLSGQPFFLLHT